jgi:hypothetical protein
VPEAAAGAAVTAEIEHINVEAVPHEIQRRVSVEFRMLAEVMYYDHGRSIGQQAPPAFDINARADVIDRDRCDEFF